MRLPKGQGVIRTPSRRAFPRFFGLVQLWGTRWLAWWCRNLLRIINLVPLDSRQDAAPRWGQESHFLARGFASGRCQGQADAFFQDFWPAARRDRPPLLA
jgi:hypothetical protein